MSESGDVFNIERLRELIELMEEHNLREVELRQGEQQIQLKRGAEASLAPVAAPVAAPQTVPATASPAPAAGADVGNFTFIESPMVGTFYSKPNPESPSFVKVGDRVNAETTICIIEAMKVFNEIPAGCSGTVVAILADNEEPVDFGKKLFKIDPAG
jgi:acetyl-CoA carboxylase biotin carboxyl carrier protein